MTQPRNPVLLRLADVCQSLGVSKSTVYQLLDTDPTFPSPVQVTARAVRWRRADVEEWARSRPSARPRRADRKAGV